jgi:hypothetical protein
MRKKLRPNPSVTGARPGQCLGIVLNPKTLEPCFPFKAAGKKRTVGFYAGKDMQDPMGAGYFDEPSNDDYDTSMSGFPRGHTPDGVRVTKAGYGTVLYTSLCLGATMTSRGLVELETDPEAEGISSNEHRSRSADLWWSHALERGLSYQTDIEGEVEHETVERSEDFSFDIGRRGRGRAQDKVWDAAEELVGNDTPGSISNMDISITGTTEWEDDDESRTKEQTVDIYEFDKASQFIPYFSLGMSGGDPVWLLIDPDADMEFDEAIFSTMLLTGCAPEVVGFIERITKRCGMPELFQKLMIVAQLDNRAGAVIDDVDAPATGDLRPNPSRKASKRARAAFLATLNKSERFLLETRKEIIEATGLDKFRDFDD